MLENSVIEDFASLVLCNDHLPTDYNVWYVGTENSMADGIDDLLDNLIKRGHILIDKLEIVDYIWDVYPKNEIAYVILYKSLSTLEYLEYMSKKLEEKNEDL